MDKWIPQPGAQVYFLSCPVFECLLEGTRGGGKTDALLMSFAQFVGRGYGAAWRGILFRETYPQLADVVKKSKRWFKLFFPQAKFNEADFVWKFPGGEELLFRHGAKEDDYWNYHGHEYPWIGFEELTNWRDPAFYEAMFSCCRSSQPGMPRMVRATTNPWGRGHGWVKERFKLGRDGVRSGTVMQDKDGRARTFVHSTLSENKILLENDPDYIKTMEGLRDPARRAAWLDGDWDINAGAFLEGVWDAKRHIVQPFAIPSTWQVWRGFDWGFAKPFACYWFALDHDGCYYIWRELYGCEVDEQGKVKPNTGVKQTPDVVAKRIVEAEKHDARMGLEYVQSYAGTDIFGAAGSQYGQQNTHAKIFKDNGVIWREAWTAPKSRAAGAQEIIRLLAEDKLKVFSTCKHWIRTVPAIPPDPDNPDDVDTEAEDHGWDATRYGVMRRRFANKADGQVIVDYEKSLVTINDDGTHTVAREAHRRD